MNVEPPVRLDFVAGDATGLLIPAQERALREAGADFLTQAFRAFGSLVPENSVTEITHCAPCAAGNSGSKMFLSVAYARDEPGLHKDLFVKFSRDFDDAFRDRRRAELEAEVRLAKLSCHPAFPVEAPKAYFGDFDVETGTGILITQLVPFGEGAIEPLHPKCMDHELADPLSYYRVLITALARLAAAHKSGRLDPDIERLFPYDAAKAAADLPIALDEASVREKVAAYARFAKTCARLLPPHLKSPDFIAKFETDALRFLQHEKKVRRFLHADPDFIALCHWNTNIDNAWFWRDAAGALHCGLLDWGMVRQMNVAYGIWGGLSAAELSLFDNHLDELLALFTRVLADGGGPAVDPARLRLHMDLSMAMLGLALMMDVPNLVLSRLPEAAQATSPLDPILHNNEVARCFLQVFTNFLNLWARHDFGASLDLMLHCEDA